MTERLRAGLATAKRRFGDWASGHGVEMLRVALGIVFVGFGVLKFCPGLCDVELIAQTTMQVLMLGLIPARACIWTSGTVECGIGGMLMAGRAMRLTTICLMLHLRGTFLPLVLSPGDTWKHFPYAPTLVARRRRTPVRAGQLDPLLEI